MPDRCFDATFRPILTDPEGHPIVTTVTAPESITRGWNYRPGTYRCDRGWNDDTETYECRDAGVDEIDGEWLCEYHAKQAEAALATPIKCCFECRTAAHLPPLEAELGTWHICLACDSAWYDEIDDPPGPRTAGDVAWIGFMLTSLMFVLYLWARNVVLHGHTGPDGHLAFEPGDLGTLGVAVLSWFCAVTVVSRIVAAVSGGLARLVHFVRGTEWRREV